MKNLRGLATGIGSLPYTDADKALDLIFGCVPQIPFWPQLPKRGAYEGMVAQFSEHMPCLKLVPDGLIFDERAKERELEAFYESIIANDIDYFAISRDFALGLHKFYERLEKEGARNAEFIKCQITGPFTFAASLSNNNGVTLLHDPVFFQAIIKGLAMKALWQIKLFRKFGRKIILFIDEPYLAAFGSAYTPLNRQEVLAGLTELTEALSSEDVLIGVHCCGNTDWSIFTAVKGIDIINFDAYAFLDKFLIYAPNLNDFLKRDGAICWGVVPTQEYTGKETADSLVERVKEGIAQLEKKGLDRNLLLENLLLSPACGLGALDEARAGKIFELLSQTSRKISEK